MATAITVKSIDLEKLFNTPKTNKIESSYSYVLDAIARAGLKGAGFKLMAELFSKRFGNVQYVNSRRQISENILYNERTVTRTIKLMEQQNLISVERSRKKGFIIEITEFCLMIPKLVKIFGQKRFDELKRLYEKLKQQYLILKNRPDNDDRVEPSKAAKCHPESGKMSLYTLIYNNLLNKKEQTPEPAANQSETRKPVKPSAVHFSKKIDKKLGSCAESIKKSCQKIEKMALESGQAFNADKAAAWCISKNYHPAAIEKAFATMASPDVWPGIKSPYAWLSGALKTASANFNEQDHIKASNDLKVAEKSFCDILGSLLPSLT